MAVSTSHWTHTSEADFAAGTMERVVATNLGDVKLSRAVRSILAQDARVSAIHALAQAPDGTIYAATGPQGVLLKIKDEQVSDAAQLGDNVNLFSLLIDQQNRVLIGTGGEQGEVYRINQAGEKPEKIFSAEGVQYVWSMLQSADGMIYLATGPTGQLHSLSPEGKTEIVHDSDENNLLCLAADGTTDLLYAGTDPHGLVLRINRRTKQTFVVYDAAETEITALVRTSNGELLAATAQATDGEEIPAVAVEQTGRPEGNIGGVPIEAVPPENPKPPELPEPPPTEPKPIPKFMSVLSMSQDQDTAPATTEPAAPAADGMLAVVPARGALSTDPVVAGNAVYRIDADGFVTELMRSNLAIYALLEQNGEIFAGTGNDGLLYQLRPAAEETIVLAKVDSKQILCALSAADGRVYLGCANRGDIVAMSSGFAETGTYTSPVLDAAQISRFGQLRLRGKLPDGATLKVSTRSGNVSDPAGSSGWSEWTDGASAAEFLPIAAPPARFFQYRLSFGSADGKQTAVVEDVDAAYQSPNLAPKVTAIRVVNGDIANADTRPKHTISWDAADANADAMVYSLQLRALPSGEWITIKDKLTDATFEWDTRTVADGRYELRVLATDAASNTPGSGKTGTRTSEPLTVDNTPPAIGDLSATADGKSAQVKLSVVDRTSTVAKVEYALDGAADWQIVLPVDMIADSPKEAYAATLADLKPGPHQIALRATDSAGNVAFATVGVRIEP